MYGGSFGYDPEAVIQDADIEMAEMIEQANEAVAMRKKGNCDHGCTGPMLDGTGRFNCAHCGMIWESWEARDAYTEELWNSGRRWDYVGHPVKEV